LSPNHNSTPPVRIGAGDQLLSGEILRDRGDQVGRVRHRPARIRLAIRKRMDGRKP
jgi:hypothetical protein